MHVRLGRSWSIPAVFAALTVVLAACEKKEEGPPPDPPALPVRVLTLQEADAQDRLVLSGVSRASEESQLSFKVEGTIQEIGVSVGDRVRRGQMIARVDPAPYQLQLEEAQAGLAQAQAEARNAAARYERVQELYVNGNASRSDLDTARAAAEATKAAVASLGKRVELARLRVSDTRLLAPAAGQIASVSMEVNENARAGAPIALLVSGDGVEVEVAVPERTINRIRRGMQANVTIEAISRTDLSAQVTEVGVSPQGNAAAFLVVLRIQNPGPKLRLGMVAEVEFSLPRESGAGVLRVPAIAVGSDASGRYVFVVETAADGSGRARKRPIEVGDLGDQGFEVRTGLQPGDTIITAGLSRLEDGIKVRPVDGP